MQLLDVALGQVRWSETIEWDPVRIMEIGGSIADAVLRTLELSAIRRTQFAGTENREAYEAYLMGKKYFDMRNAKNTAVAIEYFEKAVALDPTYVRGHVMLAAAYYNYGQLASSTPAEEEEWTQKAQASANHVIELDPDSPDAVSMFGIFTENAELREQLLKRALELGPNHGQTLFRYAAFVLRPAGKNDEAAVLLQRLVDLDPLNAFKRHTLARTLWDLERLDEAVSQFEKAIQLQPDMIINYHRLGYLMVFEYGRLDEAVILHRQAYAANPETGFQAAPVAQQYAALGMRTEALRFLNKALEWMEWEPSVLFMAGHAYDRLGDKEKSIEYFMRFIEIVPDKQHPGIPGLLTERDLWEGRYEAALERHRETYPESTSLEAAPDDLMFLYARLLKAAGYVEEARLRFDRIAEHLESICGEDRNDFLCRYSTWRVYAELGDRRKTLDWLRFSLLDKPYFANNQDFNSESLDFLREDAEFRELMGYLDAEMDKQRARIRQIECDGEMPPAPGIDTSDFCY